MEPAGALAVAGLKSWVERQGGAARPEAGGDPVRREHELRPAALRRGARRARRGARGAARRDDPGAARRLPRVLRGDRPARRDRVQLPADRPRARRTSSSGDDRDSRRTRPTSPTTCARRGYPTRRPHRQRDGQAARALHGRAAAPRTSRDERLFRFEFPERPGALLQFLDTLGGRFNISLFHYRNHGADFGRVLCAFEVPDADLPELRAFLDRLGYESVAEVDNEAYRLFLSGS